MRKFKKRLPSGRIKLRTKRVKAGFARCARCKSILHGIPRMHSSAVGKVAKSDRTPQRAMGGYYCASCVREIFREKAREMV